MGQVIFDARSRLKMTQEEVASKAGLSWRYLQNIESARKASKSIHLKSISLSVFAGIANALGISPDDLLKKALEHTKIR